MNYVNRAFKIWTHVRIFSIKYLLWYFKPIELKIDQRSTLNISKLFLKLLLFLKILCSVINRAIKLFYNFTHWFSTDVIYISYLHFVEKYLLVLNIEIIITLFVCEIIQFNINKSKILSFPNIYKKYTFKWFLIIFAIT